MPRSTSRIDICRILDLLTIQIPESRTHQERIPFVVNRDLLQIFYPQEIPKQSTKTITKNIPSYANCRHCCTLAFCTLAF